MFDLSDEFTELEEHNGVTFTRLPNNPNVAVVQNLEDLSLWRARKDVGLNGILTDFPADPETLKRTADQLVKTAQREGSVFNPLMHANMDSPSAMSLQSSLFARAWKTTKDENDGMTPYKLPPAVQQMSADIQDVISTMADTYVNKAGAESGTGDLITLHTRVNSDYPIMPHRHIIKDGDGNEIARGGDSMAIALSGDGTVIYPDENYENAYTMKTGQIGIFDETVWHSAAPYDDNWEDEPRTNLILG